MNTAPKNPEMQSPAAKPLGPVENVDRSREQAAVIGSTREQLQGLSNEVIREKSLSKLDGIIKSFEFAPSKKNEEALKQYNSSMQGIRMALLAALTQKINHVIEHPQSGLTLESAAETFIQEQFVELQKIAGRDGIGDSISLDDLSQDEQFSFPLKMLRIVDRKKSLVVIERELDDDGKEDPKGEEIGAHLKGDDAEKKYQEVWELAKSHLLARAKSIVSAGMPIGSAEAFAAEVESVAMRTVGAGYLRMENFTDSQSKKKFRGLSELWTELQKDPNIKAILSSENADAANETLEKLLDADDGEAELKKRLMRTAEKEQIEAMGDKLAGDVSLGKMLGFGLILTSLATVAVNALMNNKNFYKSKLLWGAAAVSAGTTAYMFPEILRGKTPEQVQAQEKFTTEIEKRESEKRPDKQKTFAKVKTWLSVVSWQDLRPNSPLARLLKQKNLSGSREISSLELSSKLAPNSLPDLSENYIGPETDEGKQLFADLLLCQQQEIDPKKLLQQQETAEDA